MKTFLIKGIDAINPLEIESYIENASGYQAVEKVLKQIRPDELIAEIEAAGLRGRGGAGFPTHIKWRSAAGSDADQRYIICNADEGEPGTFKDRFLLEHNPHLIIEGMLISGYALSATVGYIYIRGEFTEAVELIKKAIDAAYRRGFLGTDILGSGFDFDLKIALGRGAYICGEETALINSIEGKRGEARCKPPFPATAGLFGKPTVVDNVETICNIPFIIRNGSKWFSSIGIPGSHGTKLFAISGCVEKPGVYEAEMGVRLSDLTDMAGGIRKGSRLSCILCGGASGGWLKPDSLDIKMDFESLKKVGSSLGSGAVSFFDDNCDLLELVEKNISFFADESCGNCTPCREGTAQLQRYISRIIDGENSRDILDKLKRIADTMLKASRCGLGQAAPVSILSAMRVFPELFDKANGRN